MALDAGPPVSLSLSWLTEPDASDQAAGSKAEKESAPADADEEKPAEVVAEAVSPAEGAESAPPEAVELEEPDPDAKPEPGEPAAPAGVEEPVATSEPVALVDVEAENRILPRAERPEEG
jgi:hypothetical protein